MSLLSYQKKHKIILKEILDYVTEKTYEYKIFLI